MVIVAENKHSMAPEYSGHAASGNLLTRLWQLKQQAMQTVVTV